MRPMQESPPLRDPPNPSAQEFNRLVAARNWAAACLGLDSVELIPVSGDASFRRYFRLHTGTGPLILMDAPPERENSRHFVDIAARLRSAGLRAPAVLNFDFDQGFGLLEDLGDELYRDILTPQTVAALFPGLFGVLHCMARQVDASGLPAYDQQRLQAELDLFPDWYLQQHCQRILNKAELNGWRDACETLQANAAAQPQVFVHRDFHSCNLLYRQGQAPGVIDFQDAVRGPLSYDFISLLWDRYISWPRPQLEAWMESYRHQLQPSVPAADWVRWCDLMGLQRNLKIVGIFSRLHYRDGKAGYLEMIPRFYAYLLDVLPFYPELRPLQSLLEQNLLEQNLQEQAQCAP
jgi:N-acetylmuramate 1-kinase